MADPARSQGPGSWYTAHRQPLPDVCMDVVEKLEQLHVSEFKAQFFVDSVRNFRTSSKE